MTLMIPRMLLMLTIGALMVVLVNLFLLGHDRKRAMGPIRTFLCRNSVRICVWLMALLGWWTLLTYKHLSRDDVDFYEEYLGPVAE